MFKRSTFLRVLGLFPKPLHRACLRVLHSVRYRWQLASGMVSKNCVVIAVNRNREFLLVRHSYPDPSFWGLPGGGFSKNEEPVDTARREIREELGCELVEAELFELEDLKQWGCHYFTYLIGGVIEGELRPDGREVLDAGFFPLGEFPEPVLDVALERITRWAAQTPRLDGEALAALQCALEEREEPAPVVRWSRAV